jgi:hypothetical protein
VLQHFRVGKCNIHHLSGFTKAATDEEAQLEDLSMACRKCAQYSFDSHPGQTVRLQFPGPRRIIVQVQQVGLYCRYLNSECRPPVARQYRAGRHKKDRGSRFTNAPLSAEAELRGVDEVGMTHPDEPQETATAFWIRARWVADSRCNERSGARSADRAPEVVRIRRTRREVRPRPSPGFPPGTCARPCSPAR